MNKINVLILSLLLVACGGKSNIESGDQTVKLTEISEGNSVNGSETSASMNSEESSLATTSEAESVIISGNEEISDRQDEELIQGIMAKQEEAWNNGDLINFMVGYWENDSLMFIGKSGITYGYDNTLKRYQSGYDSQEKMGTLKFTFDQMKRVSPDVYLVVGKYHLSRTIGDAKGIFSLVWKKIDGVWVIVADHSE